MRHDLAAPTTTVNRKRIPVFTIYPITETPAEVLLGTATGGSDYSAYVVGMNQSSTGMSVRLTTSATFVAGQCVKVTDTLNGSSVLVFAGVIESVQGIRNARGADKSTNLVIRRRDAAPYWREVRRVSQEYLPGTDLGYIARDIAVQAGLATTEFDLPNVGVSVLHGSTQLAELTLWGMLETCLAPGMVEPFVDGRGLLKWISRDIRRKPDYELTVWDSVIEVGASTSTQKVTAVRVKYVSPTLVKVSQQQRVLASGQLTCSVFKGDSHVDLWWSDDRKQRADNLAFRVRQSINDGVVGTIGTETFTQTSEFGGTVEVESNFAETWVTIAAFITGFAASFFIPDPIVPISGPTVPAAGSGIVKSLAITGLIYMIIRNGNGIYEIEGTPYDYVSETNELEAYDSAAPAWAEKIEIFESSLIPSQDVALSIASGELLYRSRASSMTTLVMVDDFRYEPGDIILLPDATRFYIVDYSRDLTRGSAAEIELQGFFT